MGIVVISIRFLEEIYWIRERVQEPVFLGNAPGRPAFQYMRALFEKIPELHMIVETDASALVQMNELRNKFEVCAITLESPNFPVV
jgi:hypothetical protein